MCAKSTRDPWQSKTGQVVATRHPTYVRSLSFTNVRCFGRDTQTIDFCAADDLPSQWTVLIGNNGTGKTTLLECLIAFDPIESPVSETDVIIRAMHWRAVNGDTHLLRIEHEGEAELQLRYELGSPLRTKKRGSESHCVALGLSEARGSVGFADKIRTPTFYAYGAGRRMGNASLSDESVSDATASLLDDKADLRNAEEWLLKLDYSATKSNGNSVKSRQKQRFEQARELLIDILPDVSDIRVTTPSEVRPQPRVEFKTEDGWIPLRWVGYGYQTLIAWVVDFASRMVERYPKHKDPLAQPAVVLVDEIDLHLHPKWQRSLMTYLSERFPNTQFIVTAHSPIFVQAAKDANLVVLRRDKKKKYVVIDNSPEAIQGWRIDQILTSDLFGLKSARPPEVEAALRERTKLIEKGSLSGKEKKRLVQLESQVADLPTGETFQDAKTRGLLERTLTELEKQLEG